MFRSTEGQRISFNHNAVFFPPTPYAHTDIGAPVKETGSNSPSVSPLESGKMGAGIGKGLERKEGGENIS